MATNINRYLNDVRIDLRLDPYAESEVIKELKSHLEEEFDDLKISGMSEAEAEGKCVKLFGPAKLVATQMYEAHSQGSWQQSLLASTPHLLFALLFALNWWQGIFWTVVTIGIILLIAVYGWLNGKPIWLFSWLGYSLLPVVLAGVLLLYLPKVWSWITILIYLPMALWIIYSVTVKTIHRDWLYTDLMFLPLPVIIAWIFVVDDDRLFKLQAEYINEFSLSIAFSFLALAITAAIFVRLRKRWLRTILLIVSQLVIVFLITLYTRGRLSIPLFVVTIMAIILVLKLLSITDKKIRDNRRRLIP
ncbi:MAG: permease prefix domain 1-containing protein [Chloroflexi bacterium]|nr:permease prefix domain 1-containing protein [Chloroflexota bacterium]